MTEHRIKILEDGTRVYSNHTRYKPRTQRVNAVRKPEDPRAERWYGEWLLPLDLLGEDQRQMPETRPDTVAYEHMGRGKRCRCTICRRPSAKEWKKKWRREQRQMRMPPSSSTTI